MRKSKVLTKALAAILCIAMLIPMAVIPWAAARNRQRAPGHHQRQHQRLSMTDQREVALSFNLGYKPRRPTWSGPSATSPSASG